MKRLFLVLAMFLVAGSAFAQAPAAVFDRFTLNIPYVGTGGTASTSATRTYPQIIGIYGRIAGTGAGNGRYSATDSIAIVVNVPSLRGNAAPFAPGSLSSASAVFMHTGAGPNGAWANMAKKANGVDGMDWRDPVVGRMTNLGGGAWGIVFSPNRFFLGNAAATTPASGNIRFMGFVFNDGPNGTAEGKDVNNSDFLIDFGANATISSVSIRDGQGIVYSMQQPSPSPAVDQTTINYQVLNSMQPINISVMDVFGNVVAELVNGTVAPGSHTVTWNLNNTNGTKVPSGMYVVEIKSGSYSSIRKLMVTR